MDQKEVSANESEEYPRITLEEFVDKYDVDPDTYLLNQSMELGLIPVTLEDRPILGEPGKEARIFVYNTGNGNLEDVVKNLKKALDAIPSSSVGYYLFKGKEATDYSDESSDFISLDFYLKTKDDSGDTVTVNHLFVFESLKAAEAGYRSFHKLEGGQSWLSLMPPVPGIRERMSGRVKDVVRRKKKKQ